MKFKKATTAGLLLVGLGSTSLAIPPPCGSADAAALLRGWALLSRIQRRTAGTTRAGGAGRWRAWSRMSAGTSRSAATADSEIPTVRRPTAKDEDRKAPPPTTPTRKNSSCARSRPAMRPPDRARGSGGTATAPAMPMLPPGDPTSQSSAAAVCPQNRSPSRTALNSTGPTSDLDPPPSLPFGPQQLQFAQPTSPRSTASGPAMPAARPARDVGTVRRSDDPPPALPGTLATLSN